MRNFAVFIMFISFLFANTQSSTNELYNPNIECLILEDENSIVCKFEVQKDEESSQKVTINWISPNGEISRSRELEVAPFDTSVYDFRYLDGREKGLWSFVIIYKNSQYSSNFELK